MKGQPLCGSMMLAELVAKSGPHAIFSDGDWVESKDQDPDGDVRLLQLADVGDGIYVDKSARFMTSERARELRCTYLEPNDILIARMPDPLGRACVFPGDPRPCVTVVDVCVVRTGDGIDRRWLVYQLNSSSFRQQIGRFINGTTRQRISRTNLAQLTVSVPPLPEQRRIAHILDKADAIRRKRKEAIALTEELLRSTFLDMFGDPVTNPKGWKDAALGALADIASGVTKGKRYDGAKMVEVPYMRVANVQDGHLALGEIKTITVSEDDARRYLLEPGDVLLTEGGDPDKLGRGAVWRGEVPGCIHQNHIFRVRANGAVLPEYLSALLGSERGKRYFFKAAKQTTGIASINMTQLKAFPALVPPLEVQHKYLAVVERAAALRRRQEEAAHAQDQLFSSLVDRAFRGELTTKPAPAQTDLLTTRPR